MLVFYSFLALLNFYNSFSIREADMVGFWLFFEYFVAFLIVFLFSFSLLIFNSVFEDCQKDRWKINRSLFMFLKCKF